MLRELIRIQTRRKIQRRLMMKLRLIASVCVLTGVIFSILQAQTFPTVRDPLKWPFAQNSIWNLPIGSNAVYVPAGIKASAGTKLLPDQDIIIMKPTAPLTNIFYNSIGWSNGDRCIPTTTLRQTGTIPTDFVIGDEITNASTAILMPDGRTVIQNQPFARCKAGGPATSMYYSPDVDIMSSTGEYGSHGGNRLSALGGTIRIGEFTAGVIRHAMKVNLWSRQYFYQHKKIWPALYCDGDQGGTNQYLNEGSLLALLPAFKVDALLTVPGKILAKAFQDYGAYVVDDVACDCWALIPERGPDGSVDKEFQTLYGYSMVMFSHTHPFWKDMQQIFENLNIIINNSPTNVGGGGTRRQPLAPPFGVSGVLAPSPARHTMPSQGVRFALVRDQEHLRVAVVGPNGRMLDIMGKVYK
jgi:hypothetical protein